MHQSAIDQRSRRATAANRDWRRQAHQTGGHGRGIGNVVGDGSENARKTGNGRCAIAAQHAAAELALGQISRARAQEKREEGFEISASIVDRSRSQHENTGVPRELRDPPVPPRSGISCVMCFIENEDLRPAFGRVTPAQSFIGDEISVNVRPSERLSPHWFERCRCNNQSVGEATGYRESNESFSHPHLIAEYGSPELLKSRD
jgi:hypothetical protein